MTRLFALLPVLALAVLFSAPVTLAAPQSRFLKRSGPVIISTKNVQVVDVTPPGHTTRWHLVYNFERQTVALVRITPVTAGGLQVVSVQSLTKPAKPQSRARFHAKP